MTRPNILWICLDQLRWDWLGCTGHPLVRTPRIDDLAAAGVCCDRAYCQAPVCMPSRASFLSGCYPRSIGLRQNGQDLPAHAEHRLLPVQLAAAGYATANFGKLHLRAVDRSMSLGPGWRDLPRGLHHHQREPGMEAIYQVVHWDHNGAAVHAGSDFRSWLQAGGADPDRPLPPHPDCPHVVQGRSAEQHCSTWIGETCCAWLRDQADTGRPWLASVNIIDPHHPFDPPPEALAAWQDRLAALPLPRLDPDEHSHAPPLFARYHRAAYNEPWFDLDWQALTPAQHRLMQAAYGAMIEHLDAQIGRILDTLDAIGQRDDTIVVLHNDHGELLGEHGVYYKGPFHYEASVRTPLIWRYPARIPAGQRRHALLELVDVAPTLASFCGLQSVAGMQGRDCSSWLCDAAAPDRWRDTVYCEYLHDAVPGHGDGCVHAAMLRGEQAKLVHWSGCDHGEYYDLVSDPHEQRNRWHDPDLAGSRSSMHQALCDRLVGMVDPLPARTGMY